MTRWSGSAVMSRRHSYQCCGKPCSARTGVPRAVLGDVHAQAVGEVDVAVGDAFELGWVHAVISTRSRDLTVRPGLLKDRRERADSGNVLWLIGIASVWSFVSLLCRRPVQRRRARRPGRCSNSRPRSLRSRRRPTSASSPRSRNRRRRPRARRVRQCARQFTSPSRIMAGQCAPPWSSSSPSSSLRPRTRARRPLGRQGTRRAGPRRTSTGSGRARRAPAASGSRCARRR